VSYHTGDTLRVTATYVNYLGSPAIPGSVVALVGNPSGAVATFPQASHSTLASGVYAFEQVLDTAGTWTVRVAGLGSNRAADEFSITVNPSLFA
jgi:hypothetical protein